MGFLQWLQVMIGSGLACFLGLWYLEAGGRVISPMWPAAGVAMAFFIRYGWRAAPAVIISHMVVWTVIPPSGPSWPVLFVPFVYSFEAWLVGYVGYRNHRISGTHRTTLCPVAWSYFGAPILCSLPAALFATLAFTGSGRFSADDLWTTFFLIVMAHAHGIMALGNLSIHLLQGDFNPSDLTKSWNGTLAGIAALVVMVLSFIGTFDTFLSPGSAILLPFPLLVMAAIWLPPAPVSLLVALWCMLSTALVCLGQGPFVAGSVAGHTVNPAELGLYNMVMSSVAYMLSVGTFHLSRQLDLNQIALDAAGIELWEWESGRGFSWVQGNPISPPLREATNGWKPEEILDKLVGSRPASSTIADSWRSRIKGNALHPGNTTSELTLESVGRVLQRDANGRPVKAIGLLQDLSALQRAEEALVALGYQRAKLRGLQAKLAPHFLFNSLNVIHALVHRDPDRADEAITSLANLLRNNLRTTDTLLIDLSEELNDIRALLHLASLRFGDRITTRIRVPAELLSTPVPPMMLLNLVENAITHGIGNLEQGGTISVTAQSTAEQVRISIRNSGTLPENATRGVGTRDALQRLEILFAGKARFSLSQMDAETVSADIDLPLPHASLS